MRWARWAVTAVTCGAIAAGSWIMTRPDGSAAPPPGPSPALTPFPLTAPPALDGVPEPMVGRWRGNAEGPGGTYELELELTRGTRGQTVGESGVVAATCRFGIVLRGTEPDAILFDEKLTSGSGCMGSSGRLSFHGERLRYSALTDDGDPVTGELRRA